MKTINNASIGLSFARRGPFDHVMTAIELVEAFERIVDKGNKTRVASVFALGPDFYIDTLTIDNEEYKDNESFCTEEEAHRILAGISETFHKLRDKEIQALNLLFYYEYEIAKEVGTDDPELIRQLLFSKESKAKIKKDLGYTDNNVFNNLLSSLRKKGVLTKENVLNASVRPPSSDTFNLLINFNDEDNQEGKSGDEKDS